LIVITWMFELNTSIKGLILMNKCWMDIFVTYSNLSIIQEHINMRLFGFYTGTYFTVKK